MTDRPFLGDALKRMQAGTEGHHAQDCRPLPGCFGDRQMYPVLGSDIVKIVGHLADNRDLLVRLPRAAHPGVNGLQGVPPVRGTRRDLARVQRLESANVAKEAIGEDARFGRDVSHGCATRRGVRPNARRFGEAVNVPVCNYVSLA
jgi:hypothetical protein